MRKRFAIFIIIILVFLISGCMNNTSAVQEDYKHEKETIVDDHSINNKKDSTENNEMHSSNEKENIWFSTETFEKVTNLTGKVFEKQREVMSQNEFYDLIRNPLNFHNWELLTQSGKLIRYQFEDIEYFTNEGDKEIDYYNLGEYFSEDIFYSSFSDGAASILIDYKNHIMAILKNEYSKKVIINASKFNESFELGDLTFLGGYEENGKYRVAFMDKNNNFYMINTDPIELVAEKKIRDWKFISGYTDVDYIHDKEALCGYFINELENKLSKELLSHDEGIYTIDIDKRIKGSITKIESDMEMTFLLSKVKDNYVLYLIKENDFSFLEIREEDANGKLFENIDDIHVYVQNEKNIYLILFNKNSQIPIKKIEAYGLEWQELN